MKNVSSVLGSCQIRDDVTRSISTDVLNCAVNSGFCRSGSKDNAHQQSDDIMDALCIVGECR